MTDTTPEADAAVMAMLSRRSGSDRVRMCCEMFTLARALAIAGIRAAEPDIDDAALRVRLFERFYGQDFTLEERARIVRTLRAPVPDSPE